MNPKTDCPKWISCSAAICPIEADWRKQKMLPGERVCYYACESVKEGAQARFEASTQGELYLTLAQVLPEVMSRWWNIRRTIEIARSTGSRMDWNPHGRGQP